MVEVAPYAQLSPIKFSLVLFLQYSLCWSYCCLSLFWPRSHFLLLKQTELTQVPTKNSCHVFTLPEGLQCACVAIYVWLCVGVCEQEYRREFQGVLVTAIPAVLTPVTTIKFDPPYFQTLIGWSPIVDSLDRLIVTENQAWWLDFIKQLLIFWSYSIRRWPPTFNGIQSGTGSK